MFYKYLENLFIFMEKYNKNNDYLKDAINYNNIIINILRKNSNNSIGGGIDYNKITELHKNIQSNIKTISNNLNNKHCINKTELERFIIILKAMHSYISTLQSLVKDENLTIFKEQLATIGNILEKY